MKSELVLRILDHSHALISSARIEGATVFNPQGDRIGSMHSIMLDKKSGHAEYAVMLLDGDDLPAKAHPLPWSMLHYDAALPGYRVDLSADVLASAPAFLLDEADRPQAFSLADLARHYGEDGAIPLPIEENDFNAQTI